MRNRPHRTLLSPSSTGSRAAASTATTPAQAVHAENDVPTFQQLPPARLHEMLARHGVVGRRLGRLLGVTTIWASTRWVAGPERGTVVPSFHILVPGACPGRETGEMVTSRLQHHGWSWRLIADHGVFRVDARREGSSVTISAHRNTISFTVLGAPVAIGPTQARLLLAGVYDDEVEDASAA